MKANQILKAITGSDKASQYVKDQCKTFADIFAMVRELREDIVSVEVKEEPFYLGSYCTFSHYKNGHITTHKGTEMPGEVWNFKTAKGTYKQTIPTGNEFYWAFRGLFAAEMIPQAERQTIAADFEWEFTKEQSSIIRTAAKFCGKDGLRPATMNVRLEIEPGQIKVVATDSYRLFVKTLVNSQDMAFGMSLLIPATVIRAAKANEPLRIELFKNDGQFEKGKVNGVEFAYCNERYPDYMLVWPEYANYVEVFRKDLIQSLKVVSQCANKVTHQVDFHFNGMCEMRAHDLDFCNESKASVYYLDKTTPDFEISFNGKFLLECLEASKEDTVRLYSNGQSDKAILIDSDVLLMPVMKT
jgi:DNA polymerase III beta subunit, central domain